MSTTNTAPEQNKDARTLSPGWLKFIQYCEHLAFGEIANLKIQNGVPMMAEQVTKKIKFS